MDPFVSMIADYWAELQSETVVCTHTLVLRPCVEFITGSPSIGGSNMAIER